MNKVIAVVVFLVLLFFGTYFAKVHTGGGGAVFIGYALGAAAFILAPKIWKGQFNQPAQSLPPAPPSTPQSPPARPPEVKPQPFVGFQDIPKSAADKTAVRLSLPTGKE